MDLLNSRYSRLITNFLPDHYHSSLCILYHRFRVPSVTLCSRVFSEKSFITRNFRNFSEAYKFPQSFLSILETRFFFLYSKSYITILFLTFSKYLPIRRNHERATSRRIHNVRVVTFSINLDLNRRYYKSC